MFLYSRHFVTVCCEYAQPYQDLSFCHQFVGPDQSRPPEDCELYFEKEHQYQFESKLAPNHATKAAANVPGSP
jgi:hypothetical protein